MGVAIFYGIKTFAASKLWKGSYSEIEPIYRETPYANIPIEHVGFDHDHSSDIVYSSYPGPPHDSYHGTSSYGSPHDAYHGASSYGTSGYSSDDISHDISHDVSHDTNSNLSAATPYQPISRKKRSADDHSNGIQPKELVEIAFIFLGVRTNECRKRFICEMDIRSRNSPLFGMVFKFAA